MRYRQNERPPTAAGAMRQGVARLRQLNQWQLAVLVAIHDRLQRQIYAAGGVPETAAEEGAGVSPAPVDFASWWDG